MKVLENIHLKIFAVIFAFTLWFYVQGRDIVETAMKFSLIFSNVPSNLYIEEASASEVTVWVRAPKYLLTSTQKTEEKIDLSLGNYKPGKFSLGIGPESLDLPAVFEITRIQPEKVVVKLAPFMHKEVKIEADYDGRRAYKIEPEKVMVRGGRKTVEGLKQIYTERFDDTGKKKEIQVKILNPVDNIYLSHDKVNVKFR
jgi:YbbR domain-containing protein